MGASIEHVGVEVDNEWMGENVVQTGQPKDGVNSVKDGNEHQT